MQVTGINNAVAVGAGYAHTCALLATGQVHCWGNNRGGTLGDGTRLSRLTPALVGNLTGAVALAVGSHHACALTAAGATRCWGILGILETHLSPTPIAPADRFIDLAADPGYTCGLRAAGSIACWGWVGRVGNNASTLVPTDIAL